MKVSKDNNFAFKFPDIAKEWHPIKNGDLKPYMYTKGSNKRFWWQCSKDKNHEWDSVIYERTKSKNPNTCPHCRKSDR